MSVSINEIVHISVLFILHYVMLLCCIFVPGLFFIIFSHFCSFMVVWGQGHILGFWGWGFQLMGLVPVVRGLLGFLSWGSLCKHKRITLGKNGAVIIVGEVSVYV